MAEFGASSGFNLLFASGKRPDAAAIARLLETNPAAARAFSISFAPADGEGWLEVLSSGLTYDLRALAPVDAAAAVPVAHRYGFAQGAADPVGEAIAIVPGRHLSGGQNLQPVVRAMAAIVLALCLLDGVQAVAWGPAGTLLSVDYFQRAFGAWLQGGAFPALGLTALTRDASGAILSEGLGFFTGQEIRIDPILAQSPASAGKVAIRLIHSLVDGWEVTEPVEIAGPQGERLGVEPAANGRIIHVWRVH